MVDFNPTESAKGWKDEQNYKRELDRQRIRSSRSQGMDEMLARSGNAKKEGSSSGTDESILKKGKNLQEDVRRVEKGAIQLAAGNKVSGAVNIARGAKNIAGEFLGGGFLQVGILWYFVLLAAGAKDAFDMMSAELVWWLDWIIDIVMTGLLWAYLFVHGAGKKKIVGFVAPILEILPFTGFVPWWSVSVLYVGITKIEKKQ